MVRHGSGTAGEVVENVEPPERRRTLGTSPASNGGVHGVGWVALHGFIGGPGRWLLLRPRESANVETPGPASNGGGTT